MLKLQAPRALIIYTTKKDKPFICLALEFHSNTQTNIQFYFLNATIKLCICVCSIYLFNKYYGTPRCRIIYLNSNFTNLYGNMLYFTKQAVVYMCIYNIYTDVRFRSTYNRKTKLFVQ